MAGGRMGVALLLWLASCMGAAAQLACPDGAVPASPAAKLACPGGTATPPASAAASAQSPTARSAPAGSGEPIELPRSSIDATALPRAKRTHAGLYLTAEEAAIVVGLYPERVLFLDVRTRGELIFNGMPTLVDAHVPYVLDPLDVSWNETTRSFELAVNPHFASDVERQLARKALGRGDVVILLCQAGTRAARAADALANTGFTRVYAVVDGFEGDPAPDGPRKGQRIVNGWRNAGLPWTLQLDRAKMYRIDSADPAGRSPDGPP